MIELVLHNATEHIEMIVVSLRLAGHRVEQLRIRKSRYRVDERVVFLFNVVHTLSPGGFTGIADRREILFITELDGRPPGSAQHRVVPRGNVEQQFPDAVSALDGMSGRSL